MNIVGEKLVTCEKEF